MTYELHIHIDTLSSQHAVHKLHSAHWLRTRLCWRYFVVVSFLTVAAAAIRKIVPIYRELVGNAETYTQTAYEHIRDYAANSNRQREAATATAAATVVEVVEEEGEQQRVEEKS